MVLVCDHASNRVPQRLQQLGLPDAALADHIAWDPGAAQVAMALAERLNAVLVMSGYSRLVIDCNRPLSSPQSIPEISAGVVIPGNQNLSATERDTRIQTLFIPYQRAIDDILQQRQDGVTALLSIHSFTPILNNTPRPWHMGVACYRHDTFARSLYSTLSQPGDVVVGFNQPYAIESEFDYTIPEQGEARGLPSAMIEIRQDGIDSPTAVQQWAQRLENALQAWHAQGTA